MHKGHCPACEHGTGFPLPAHPPHNRMLHPLCRGAGCRVCRVRRRPTLMRVCTSTLRGGGGRPAAHAHTPSLQSNGSPTPFFFNFLSAVGLRPLRRGLGRGWAHRDSPPVPPRTFMHRDTAFRQRGSGGDLRRFVRVLPYQYGGRFPGAACAELPRARPYLSNRARLLFPRAARTPRHVPSQTRVQADLNHQNHPTPWRNSISNSIKSCTKWLSK